MRTLKFNVNDQILKKDDFCDFSNLVAGTEGYLEASFIFSNNWNGCKKAAVFLSSGKDYPIPIIDNKCDIPKEALKDYYFKMYIVGEKDGYRLITNTIRINQTRR